MLGPQRPCEPTRVWASWALGMQRKIREYLGGMSTQRWDTGADGIAALRANVQELLGQVWSGARVSYGGELRVDLGGLVPSPRSWQRGRWILGTRGSPWSLTLEGALVTSEDSDGTWVRSLDPLNGQVIDSVAVEAAGPDLRLGFASGATFIIEASKLPDWQAWELLCPDGATLIANCDGTWLREREGLAP